MSHKQTISDYLATVLELPPHARAWLLDLWDAIQVFDDGHLGVAADALDQALAAARHDDVDDAARCQQGTHHGAITRGNQLYRRHRQACRGQPLHQTSVQRL